jgi:thiamine-phosphate pyrophosphorylase
VLAAADIACLRLAADGRDRDRLEAVAARLGPLAQERGIAFLIEDDVGLARAGGADGLHLTDAAPAAIAAARAALGATLSLGVACGTSRHDAMTAAELGADYVAVTAGAASAAEEFRDFVEWWAELMTVPLVAGAAGDPAATHAWALAGADFVELDPGFWAAADPAAAVALHQQALDRAAAERASIAP